MLGLQVDFGPPRWSRGRWAAVVGTGTALAAAIAVMLLPHHEPPFEQRFAPLPLRDGGSRTAPPTQAQIVARDTRLPWGRLFDALESGVTQHVVLVSIEPSVATAAVTIDGMADDAAAMAAYVTHLSDRGLMQPRLLRYQPTAGADQKLHFVATAGWYRPADAWAAARAHDLAPSLVAPSDMHALSAELLKLAVAAGLVVRGVEQDWGNELGVAPYATLAFDVNGEWNAARDFVNRAVELQRGIALRQFSLRSAARPENIGMAGASLQGRIELRVHVEGRS